MKPGIQQFLSIFIIGTGLLLLLYMIVVEDEPGALPLLLVLGGTGWYLIIRKKIKTNTDINKPNAHYDEKN